VVKILCICWEITANITENAQNNTRKVCIWCLCALVVYGYWLFDIPRMDESWKHKHVFSVCMYMVLCDIGVYWNIYRPTKDSVHLLNLVTRNPVTRADS
jgi:hypothetical protein